MLYRPEQINHISIRPGVYIHRDARGLVLYVGKAKNLRFRVRSYFSDTDSHDVKTRELVRNIATIETIVTGSEAEALILEANLVREFKPKFNIRLRDDRRYPYIRVTVQDPYPRVEIVRRVERDGARYFGPFPNFGPVRIALNTLLPLCGVRSCTFMLPDEAPSRVCLEHHIGRCGGPCLGLQSLEAYRSGIERLVQLLSGQRSELPSEVHALMLEASERMDFERAALLRDALHGIRLLSEQQRVDLHDDGDYDIFGVASDSDRGAVAVLRVRSGLLVGRHIRAFERTDSSSTEQILTSFVSEWCFGGGEDGLTDLPDMILLPFALADQGLVEEALLSLAGRRIQIRPALRGGKARLLELATSGARQALEDERVVLEISCVRADEVLYSLQEILGLRVVPRRIVCFDISHTQGTETVASAVVFEHGEPKRSEYRRMRIKGEWGNDDFRSMEEAVRRYLKRVGDGGLPVPDLIVIDGGRGQLSSALRSLRNSGLGDIPLVALAEKEEELFRVGDPTPLRLSRSNPALHVLQRIRDEAHRVAVGYNRTLRTKRTIRSDLSDIPGIGAVRQQALLQYFGSLRAVAEASPDEIARVPGMSRVLAARVIAHIGRFR